MRWAREHPGECIIGVLSDLRFTDHGEVDPSSGTFRLYEWFPDDDELEARGYDWTPDSVKAL